MFDLGYDSKLFYTRVVQYEGSCGYEAISDQINNDRGADFQAIKDKLMATLKGLPWVDREIFAIATFGPNDVAKYQDVAQVGALIRHVVDLVDLMCTWEIAVDLRYKPRWDVWHRAAGT